MCQEVEGQIPRLQFRHGFAMPAAQDGAQPREQFTNREGLDDVIVGPAVQSDDAVDLAAAGG